MNDLFFPFIFSLTLLVLNELDKSKNFYQDFFKLFSCLSGILFLGNICYLQANNLGLEESYSLTFSCQIVSYFIFRNILK